MFPHSFHIRHLEIWWCEWTDWKARETPSSCRLPHLNYTYLQMAKSPGRCLNLSGCWDGAFIRDFKDLVCISEFRRRCALSRNNHPGKQTDAGQQEQRAQPGLGNAKAFPGWLAVIAETPQKQQTASRSFFFEWLPVNTNTSLRNANPIWFFFPQLELLQENL